MKKYQILVVGIFILSSACDPEPIASDAVIRINAKVINTNETIGINDTVKIYFETPDSFELDNGEMVKANYTTKDGGGNRVIFLVLDSTRSTGYFGAFSSIVGASKGEIVGDQKSLKFHLIDGKLKGEYYFIPKKKGVYFLENQTFGLFTANDKQYEVEFAWTYGNIDRHHQLLLDSVKPGINFNLLLQSAANDGREIYGFKAE